MRLFKTMIVSALVGLSLSTALAACATRPPAKSAVVAVKTDALPPADLLACPIAPIGFSADAEAVMPSAVREGVIRLARAYAASAGQLARLINWSTPEACTVE